jgi:hypothetical protein
MFSLAELEEVFGRLREKHDLFLIGCSGRYYKEHVALFDGFHTYGPESATFEGIDMERFLYSAADAAHEAGKIFAASVSPGQDTRVLHPRLDPTAFIPRGEGMYYNQLWRIVDASKAEIAVVKSWNELGEGTNIEPSVEFGDNYLQLTAMNVTAFKTRPAKRTRISLTGDVLERVYHEDDWREVLDSTW